MKKKSAYTEAIESFQCQIDNMDQAAIGRIAIRKSLRDIEWNLMRAWSDSKLPGPSVYLGQALGIVKGLRAGIGDEHEVKT